MQRMISHAEPLPTCRNGHVARHIHDARRASAGGGHLVECACSHTGRHAEFDDALREWRRTHGHRGPLVPVGSPVVNFRGGAAC